MASGGSRHGTGGKRVGAGRPKGSKGRSDAARDWAAKLWKQGECDEALKKILSSKSPHMLDTKVKIIMRLAEYMYGKPIQPVSGSDGEGPLEVVIRSNIPRPVRSIGGQIQ